MLKKIAGIGVAACMLALISSGAFAQNLVENWSFEEPLAQTVPWPGYFHNQDASVTGWTVTPSGRGHGLNNNLSGPNDSDQRAPFHGIGRPIPHGNQVFFMQNQPGTLSQVINGLEEGNPYLLIFYAGIRPGNPGMDFTVSLGDLELLEETRLLGAGTAPLERFEIPFVYTEDAVGDTPELAFSATWIEDVDTTILFDAVELRAPVLGADISGPGMVAEGDNVVLSASLSESVGEATYQWFYDGVELQGETGATLELMDVVIEDSGVYSVEVTDDAGSATAAFTLVVVEALPVSSFLLLSVLGLALLSVGVFTVRRAIS